MSKEGSWDVRPFIYATFYGKCEPHGGKYINQYCRTCNDGVGCCIDCKDAYHADHDVLQIRKNTGIASIHDADVDDYIDSKDIHKFTINGYLVYFIMKREPRRCYKNKDEYYCNASDCRWPLDSPNEFCSIYCKLKSINHPAIIIDHQLPTTSSITINDSINGAAKSSSNSSHENRTSKSTNKPLIVRIPLPKSNKRKRTPRRPPSQLSQSLQAKAKTKTKTKTKTNTSKIKNHKKRKPTNYSPKQPSQSNLHSNTRTKYPKFVMPLSNTDIEADFLAFIGKKPPARPKKRRNAIQNTLNGLCPGFFLDQITPNRYNAKKEDC